MQTKTMSIFLILFLSSWITSQAQNKVENKFGAISIQDAQMKSYPLDSTAEAVMLLDKADIRFDYDLNGDRGFLIITEYHTRLKILKKSALDRATIKIPYFDIGGGKSEYIDNFEGMTFNEQNGQLSKTLVGKSNIFEEKITNNYFNKKITFPNVKEGSIIEYKYQLVSSMKAVDKPRTWYFQGSIPFKRSELNIIIPNIFYYKLMMGGYLSLDENVVGRDLTDMGINGLHSIPSTSYHFLVKDAPAFRNESFITTAEDYISKIAFELSSISLPNEPIRNFTESWENIDKTLLENENFCLRLKHTNFIKDVAKLIDLKKDTLEKAQIAYKYINSQFVWNGEKGIHCNELKKVFENKKGSATDLNMLYIALLRALEIDANPVILSTRSNGRIEKEHALLDRFNYTVAHAQINGKDLLIDVTNPYNRLGVLPEDCLNNIGRLIGKNKSRFVPITAVEKAQEMRMFDVSIDGNKMNAKYSYLAGGYIASSIRQELKNDGKEKFIQALKKANSELDIKDVLFEEIENLEGNLKIGFNYAEEFEKEEIIYFNPMLLEGKITNNPFKSLTREYPIDFTKPIEVSYYLNFDIPAGYMVSETPKNLVVNLPDNEGKFSYLINVANGKLQISSKVIIKKTFFLSEEYEKLKQFYDKIVEKHSEQVVLKKK